MPISKEPRIRCCILDDGYAHLSPATSSIVLTRSTVLAKIGLSSRASCHAPAITSIGIGMLSLTAVNTILVVRLTAVTSFAPVPRWPPSEPPRSFSLAP